MTNDLPPIPGLYPTMARPSYPVCVTTEPSPSPSSSGRRRDREERGRGRTSVRERERDYVDYVHDRDRLPRPVLKHKEASRDGKRRHEYRYYSPDRSSGLYPRARSEERTSPAAAVVKEVAHSASSSNSRRPRRGRGGGGGGGGHRLEDDRNDDGFDRSPPRADKHRGRRLSTYETTGSGRRGGGGGGGDDDDDHRHHHHRKDGRRERGGGGGEDDAKGTETRSRRKQAAQNAGQTAIAAGALEAVRQRGHGNGPGEAWKRVATAALGAAAIDAAASKVRHKDPRDKGKGSLLGASLGGLVVDSLVQKLR